MANNCSVCGVDMERWGRLHICRPRCDVAQPVERRAVNADVAGSSPAVAAKSPTGAIAAIVRTVPGTYQYRDPEKRRAYQRDYMRKKRGKATKADQAQA